MNLTFFWIELERLKTKVYLRIIITSALVSFLTYRILLQNILTPISENDKGIVFGFENYFLLLIGIILVVFSLSDISFDYSSKILSNYLLHPVSPKEIIISNVLAGYTYYLPAIVIPFLLLIGLSPDFDVQQIFLIFIGILLNIPIIIDITLISTLFVKYRPLPEILSILLLVLNTLFIRFIPPELIYYLNPAYMYFLKFFGSGSISASIHPILIVGGMIFTMIVILASSLCLDRIHWSS